MNQLILLCTLLLLYPNLFSASYSSVKPYISYVSTITSGTIRSGSIAGGNTLYIRGYDISSDITKISVLVGDNYCAINVDLTSLYQIACTVPPSLQQGKVYISVYTNSIQALCSQSLCYYIYSIESTPFVQFLAPPAILPNTYFSIGASFGNSYYYNSELQVKLNEFSCSSSSSYYGSFTFISCNVAELPAGFYALTLKENTLGKGVKSLSAQIVPDNYYNPNDLVIVPDISSLSTNSGPAAGINLTITGRGFSTEIGKNKVFFEGSSCEVIASSFTSIQCNLVNTPVPTQNIPRPGHAGILQRKFSLSAANNITQLKANSFFQTGSNTAGSSKLMSFEIPYSSYGNTYAEALEGLFKAPVTGSYKFLLSAQGPAELYISTTPLNKTNLTKIAEIITGSNFRDFFTPSEAQQISSPVDLIADNYYYLQALHIMKTVNQLTVGVRIPNTQRNFFSPREVISIKINAEIERLEMIFSIQKTTETLQLVKVGEYGSMYKSRDFTYPPTADTVNGALLDLGMETLVLSKTFFDSMDQITNQSEAIRVEYRVRFFFSSPNFDDTPVLSNPNLGNFVKAANSTPTSLVAGTYTLSLNNKDIALRFDSSTDEVQTAFNNALGVLFATRVLKYGRSEEGCQYVVYFDGITDDVPEVTVKSNSLTGGKSKPTIEIKVLQDASSNDIILAPIPSEFLRTYELYSQITVRSNGILASCSGTCKYQPTTSSGWPTITAFTLTDATLEITMSNAGSKTLQDFAEVKFGGNVVNVTSYDKTTQKLICSVPLNSDGTPRIVAGLHIPTVYVKQVGFAQVGSQVSALKITQTVQTVKASGDTYAFLEFTAEGTGYGFQLDEPGRFGTQVSVGGVGCELTYLTNKLLKCRAYISVTEGPFKVTVNNVTIEVPFTFQRPSLTKGITDNCYLDIIGENFTQETSVKLVNEQQTVIEKCRSCLRNSTVIRCSTCDLPPGNYKALVTTFTSLASASQSEIPFEIAFNVSSIEPKFGSQLGGTVLTLKGYGFSETLNKNQVSISTKNGVKNVRCNVLEVKSTELKCRTDPNTVGLEGPQRVYAMIGFEFEAKCVNNCNFTFSDEHTPMVLSASSQTIRAGDYVTLDGILFKNTAQVRFDGLLANITNVTSDKMVVRVPGLAANTNVTLTVTDPTLGNYYIAPSIYFHAVLEFNRSSSNYGSLAGTYLKLYGNGFSSDTKVYVSGKPCEVVKFNSSEVTCMTSPNTTSGYIYITQNYIYDNYALYCWNCYYYPSSIYTPVITSFKTTISANSVQVTLNGSLLNMSAPILLTAKSPTFSQEVAPSSVSQSSVVATFSNLIIGSYDLELRIGDQVAKYGGKDSFKFDVAATKQSVQPSKTIVSQVGGANLTLSFTGTPLPQNISLVNVKLAGMECPVSKVTTTSITCTIPPLATKNEKVLSKERFLVGTAVISSSVSNSELAFDGSIATSWSGIYNESCWIGVDLGNDSVAEISQIQLFPKPGNDLAELQNGVFEGSNDGIVYTTFYTLTDSLHDAWNTFIFKNDARPVYRFVRYRQVNSQSNCQIAEIRFRGFKLSSLSDTDVVQVPSAIVTINGFTVANVPANVEYRKDITPVVSQINPKSGSSAGGTVVTLTGEKFTNVVEDIQVNIDKTPCQVTAANSTTITCTTGALPSVNQRTESLTGAIDVQIKGKGTAITTGVTFLYAERWSEVKTWGCDGLPIEGDSVHVPTGMYLIVDVSPPKLGAVVVEGSMVFEDKDINFGCEYLIIRNGVLKIGTEQERIKSNITITFYGDRNDEQLPIYGNKVFAVYEGMVDIHGTERVVLDTLLAVTANIGASQITVESTGDFKVGDVIVISTTSAKSTENEKKKILAINDNKLTLDSPLLYTHLSENETLQFNNSAPTIVQIKATVGLLSRNIIIQGDERSQTLKYGAHLLFYDPGTENTVVRISYTEIRYAGQAGYSERHPLNFVNAMNLAKSYVLGCSIHSGYFRGIQVKNTNYLRIQKNILYDIEGEGIVLPMGLERYNTIEENTIIQIKRNLFQYNSNPSGIKTTNPLNYIRKNKVVGSAAKGYELSFSDYVETGFSSYMVCPKGERLGAFDDNYALSCGDSALSIYYHYPKVYSCRSNIFSTLNGSLLTNLPVPTVYKNFFAARAYQGVLSYGLSSVILEGFQIADMSYNNLFIYYSDDLVNSTEIKNSLLVGKLNLKTGSISSSSSRNVLLYDIKGLFITNTSLAHFSASSELLSMQGSNPNVIFTKDLKFLDVSNRKMTLESSIVRDLDGSLTNLTGGGSVVSSTQLHLRGIPECKLNSVITNTLICNSSIEIRAIEFTDTSSWSNSIRIGQFINDNATNSTNATKNYTLWYLSSQKMLLATGYAYQIFLDYGIELSSFEVRTSPFYNEIDLPIALILNHTEPREGWDVYRINSSYSYTFDWINNSNVRFDISNKTGISKKSFGDYYHDVQAKLLYLALTGNNIGHPIYSSDTVRFRVTAYRCRYFCPSPTPLPETNNTNPDSSNSSNSSNSSYPSSYRLWSDASRWPNQTVPPEGSNVFIPLDDVVYLDVDTAALNSLEIRGQLIFNDTRSLITLTAKKIWVRGRLIAGTDSNPYSNQAIIRLIGTRTDEPFVVNFAVETGTKVLVVTGELSLIGKEKPTLVRLAENAEAGSVQIKVAGNISDFNIGDQIGIAPSGEKETEYEIRTINQIDLTYNILTLNSSLQYFHYGNGTIPRAQDGPEIEMRTEVLHLSRNIKIEGSKEDNLGARILVTSEYNNTIIKSGVINMKYVSLNYTGQTQTEKAGLTFELVNNPWSEKQSVVVGSVFKECVGFAVRFKQTQRVLFERNTIFKAQHYGIKIHKNNQNIQILNNVVVGIKPFAQALSTDFLSSSAGIVLSDETSYNVSIFGNIVSGCSTIGFLIPAPSCQDNNFFRENIAHSSSIGLFSSSNQKDCAKISRFIAYRTQYGIVSSYPNNQVDISDVILTDNSISLNLANSGNNNARRINVRDSFFAAFALQDCPKCYSQSTECSNKVAIALNKFNNRFSSLSSGSLVLGTSYNIIANIFSNFQDNLLPQCKGNKIFSLSEFAAGFVPYTTVAATLLLNSDKNSLALFRPPVANDTNCGVEFPCTLVLNSLIRDTDGSFTKNGKPAALLPNNPGVIDSSSCTLNSAINGYICDDKYALLGFQVLDTDKNLLLLSPVQISNSNGFLNQIYSHRSITPSASDAQKFISIIQTNSSYNISFPKDMPLKIQFEMQGEPNQFAIVKLQYNSRKVISVTHAALSTYANSRKAQPDGVTEIRPEDPCGTYIFDRQAGTVEFKITSDKSCILLIEQTNSLVANIRFDITVEEFFAQGGVAPFIDKVAALLNIPSKRIRVVEIYRGSTGVVFAIDAESQGQDSKVAAEEQLKTVTADLQKAVDTGALSLYGAPVLSISHTTVLVETKENQEPIIVSVVPNSDSSIGLILAIVIPICVITILVVSYFVWKFKKSKRMKKYLSQIAPDAPKEVA